LKSAASCFQSIFDSSRLVFGATNSYANTISVRRMLGIAGPRTDEVTGEVLSEGEQFRELLLKNENLDGAGGVGVSFSTNLAPGNDLWSSDVCADRILTVQGQIVGDFLGDNEAKVQVVLAGDAVMRACDSDQLTTWSLDAPGAGPSAVASIGAGVNTFGESAANTSLFGQSVARASWRIVIPGRSVAPENGDLDITHVDDVLLKVTHSAIARRSTPFPIDISCLGGQL
jgi:hypothetical protein